VTENYKNSSPPISGSMDYFAKRYEKTEEDSPGIMATLKTGRKQINRKITQLRKLNK
jgi:hypothetical protein